MSASHIPRPKEVHYRLLPRSVSFAGMPADRFWEMEDGLIDLGSLDAGPTDLARLLAVESAVIYSPDWFVVPVELPIGSLAQVDWVVVTDTFGVATLVGTPTTQAADNAGRTSSRPSMRPLRMSRYCSCHRQRFTVCRARPSRMCCCSATKRPIWPGPSKRPSSAQQGGR
jgi:hypothetical protein